MNNHWHKLTALLLALIMALAMIPTGFALEAEEPSQAPEEDAEAAVSDDEPAEEAEDVISADEPAEEAEDAAAEAPDEEAVPAELSEAMPVSEEEISVISDAAASVPNGTSDTDYPALTVDVTLNYAAAAELLEALNAETSPFFMSDAALDTATELAIESVLNATGARPCGESWSTILGDQDLAVSEYDILFYHTGDDSAESVLSQLTSSSAVTSGAYDYAGIGSVTLNSGDTYWAVLLYNGKYDGSAAGRSNVSTSTSISFSEDLLADKLQFAQDSYTVGLSDALTLSVEAVNSYGLTVPVSSDELVFTGSDKNILTVAADGTVNVLKAGTVTVTAALAEAKEISAQTTVTSKLSLSTPVIQRVANAAGGVQLTWTAVPGATRIGIYRSTKSGSWTGSWIANVSGNQTTYLDKTAVGGTTYYYTVRAAYDVNGVQAALSGYNQAGVGICYQPMPTPSSAKASSDGITVSWKAVTGVGGYAVYRKANGTGSWVWLTNVSSGQSSYLDTNVTKGTKYTYTVRAYKGSYASAYSDAGVSATATATVKLIPYVTTIKVNYRTGAGTNYTVASTLAAGTKVNVISGWSQKANNATWYKIVLNGKVYYIMSQYLLATPNLKSVANNANGFVVSWDKVSNATRYCVYRKTSDSSYSFLGSCTSTSYIDTSAKSGTTYTYTVRATKGSIVSGYSSDGISGIYVKTPALTSAKAGTNQIVFSWEPVSDVDGYYVYRRENAGAWKQIAKVTDPNASSYTDKNVSTMIEYGYTVRAYKSNSLSSYVTDFVADILVPSNTLTNVALLSNTQYRTGAGTNYSASGTFKAGTYIQVVAADLNSSSTSWCRVLVTSSRGNFWRYVPKSALLSVPKLGKATIATNGIVVSWNKVSGASSYEIYRHDGDASSNSKWTQIAIVSSGDTLSYRDTSVASGSTYTYTVRAKVGSVRSWFETPGLTTQYLSVPNLTGISAAKSGITVKWSQVTGADGYYIYRKTANGNWKGIATVKSGSTKSYTDTKDLISGVTYYYTVRAYSGNVSYISGYVSSGISAKATATLNPTTVTYTVTASASYYELRNGSVLASGKKGTLNKGDTIQVVPSMAVVKDGYSEGVTYTPFLKDGNYYYINTSQIKKG